MRRESGLPKRVAITTKNKYLDEILELFYGQVTNGATLILSTDTQTPPARQVKKCEKLCKTYNLEPFVSKKSYQLLSQPDSIYVLEMFLSSLTISRLMLGYSEAINYLGPCHFKCPLKSCLTVVAMRSFNNMYDISRHLSKHKSQNRGLEHEIASSLLVRYNFLVDSQWVGQQGDISMDKMIENLDAESETTVVRDLYIPTRDSGKFAGKYHWVDEEVVSKIINREVDALATVKDPPASIVSFFSKRTSSRKDTTTQEDEVDVQVQGPGKSKKNVNVSECEDSRARNVNVKSRGPKRKVVSSSSSSSSDSSSWSSDIDSNNDDETEDHHVQEDVIRDDDGEEVERDAEKDS